MSLLIDPSMVSAVLVHGGWMSVAWLGEKSTFYLDTYTYATESGEELAKTAKGFSFENTAGEIIAGPLSSILAVKCQPSEV